LTVGAAYLLVFWSLAGQTPGMRFVAIRVVADGEARLGFWRSVRRLLGLVVATIPLGLGFIGVLLGERRRGLPDVFASTEVTYAEPAASGGPAGRV